MTEREFRRKAVHIVADYTVSHADRSTPLPKFTVYTVWMAKVLQNNKALLSTSLNDGMYYEVTFNGDKAEFYLDAYKKWDNKMIRNDDLKREVPEVEEPKTDPSASPVPEDDDDTE